LSEVGGEVELMRRGLDAFSPFDTEAEALEAAGTGAHG
jgi:hypothetical protein